MLALQVRQNGGSPSWYCHPVTRGQGLLRPKEAREEEEAPDSGVFPSSSRRGTVSPYVTLARIRAGSRAFGAGPPAPGRSTQDEPPQGISSSRVDPIYERDTGQRRIRTWYFRAVWAHLVPPEVGGRRGLPLDYPLL